MTTEQITAQLNSSISVAQSNWHTFTLACWDFVAKTKLTSDDTYIMPITETFEATEWSDFNSWVGTFSPEDWNAINLLAGGK